MAEYSNLSATINAQIRANGVQAITGPVLNAVLTAMVNVLGDGYRLNGVAVPADNPGSPDNRVAYLAAQDGTYTNFGGLTISGEVALLLWDSVWTKETLFSIDTAVTPGSGHLVTSGAVDDALTTLAGNIAAAYMQLVPGATENNLAIFDGAGQVKDSGIAAADVVKKDGVYPDLFAGYAGNLVDTRSAGTPQGPYAFRQSGGDGVDYMVRIKGKTEAFNQMVQNGNFADTSNWSAEEGISFSVSSNEAHLSMSGGAYASGYLEQTIQLYAGHNYLICFAVKCGNAGSRARILTYGGEGAETLIAWANYSAWTNVRQVVTATKNNNSFRIYADNGLDNSGDVSVDVKNFFLVDLTLEGLGITTAAQFRALHPLPYYNPMSKLINNAATGIKSRRKNAWDEDWEEGAYDTSTGEKTSQDNRFRGKNLCPCVSNTTYYLGWSGHASNDGVVLFYDADKNYIKSSFVYGIVNSTFTTPANAAFFTCYFVGTTYNHDICINLSDASRNGTYEPYWERTLALGLNSIPCHDENNNAVVVNGLDGVGDVYDEAVVENGMVTKIIKRRGRRAYQAGDESDATLMTDGTNTDYPLATPLTLTVDTPFPAFVEVDNLGTQERLPADTADNPQGGFESDSNYSVSTANLVRLLNL